MSPGQKLNRHLYRAYIFFVGMNEVFISPRGASFSAPAPAPAPPPPPRRRSFLSTRVGDVELAERRVRDLLFDERRDCESHVLAVLRTAGVAFRLLHDLFHLLEHLRGAAGEVRHGVVCFC